jgi:hypothetical protein
MDGKGEKSTLATMVPTETCCRRATTETPNTKTSETAVACNSETAQRRQHAVIGRGQYEVHCLIIAISTC